jgi:hypothetical protein
VNTAFISFFILGYDGVPRWMATYPAGAGFTTLSLISSIGAGIIGLSMMIFAYNLWISAGSASPRLPIPGRARRWNGSPVLLRRGTTSPWPTPYPGSAATHRCSTCERTPGRAGPGFDIVRYCAAATLVFALALLAWRARRRNREPLGRGLRVPARPAGSPRGANLAVPGSDPEVRSGQW